MTIHRSLTLLAAALMLNGSGMLPQTQQAIAQSQSQPNASPTDRQSDRQTCRRPPRPNFAAAAKKLGVSESALVQALGLPPRPPGNRNVPPGEGNMPPQPSEDNRASN